MINQRSFPVIDPDGVTGRVIATSRFLDDSGDRLVRMADGTEFFVPSDILVPTENEGFRLTIPVSSILQGRPDSEALVADRIVPVVEERLRVETREVETGRILIHKKVESSETVVDEPLIEETYDIVRVPANRIVTAPVEPRYEGDTLILPVLEEVLVVEKRLVLREELRVTRKRREYREPQTHTVRREHLEVERVSEPITNN